MKKMAVVIGAGAAFFSLFFMYINLPTGFLRLEIQTAFGIGAFFAVLFGPVSGGLIAFIGHALSDGIQNKYIWWSWVIASGAGGSIIGLVHSRLRLEEGVFGKKDALFFNLYQVAANIIAWILVAPILDIVIYGEPVKFVFAQGAGAAVFNMVSCGIIGTPLLKLYSKYRAGRGK